MIDEISYIIICYYYELEILQIFSIFPVGPMNYHTQAVYHRFK